MPKNTQNSIDSILLEDKIGSEDAYVIALVAALADGLMEGLLEGWPEEKIANPYTGSKRIAYARGQQIARNNIEYIDNARRGLVDEIREDISDDLNDIWDAMHDVNLNPPEIPREDEPRFTDGEPAVRGWEPSDQTAATIKQLEELVPAATDAMNKLIKSQEIQSLTDHTDDYPRTHTTSDLIARVESLVKTILSLEKDTKQLKEELNAPVPAGVTDALEDSVAYCRTDLELRGKIHHLEEKISGLRGQVKAYQTVLNVKNPLH